MHNRTESRAHAALSLAKGLAKGRAKEAARRVIWRADRGTTPALRRRFVPLEPLRVNGFRRHLRDNWSSAEYWDSEVGRHDLDEHTVGRLVYDRHEYVPWLNALRRLDGARVFEIGCGTGSSVMALVEQGAIVTGIDVVGESIAMTRARLRCFGLEEPSLHHLNATDVDAHFEQGGFDVVIFFASLEHMTHAERLQSLRAAWRLLAGGGVLCIIEAPNRLWLFDDHTSDLPFFHWLPDEIALEYLKQTPRYQAAAFDTTAEGATLELTRRGRGVSYHDIELALGPASRLDFLVDRQTYQMRQNRLRWIYYRRSGNRRYVEMLRRQRSDLPVGLFLPYLNVAIRKPGA